jgi:CDP-4-dehydro-6-deoxyglucose reductase, E1
MLKNKLNFPLMYNNISKKDISKIIEFLKKNPRLTAGDKCLEFEKAWSKWLGVKYSVFLNSGSSSNFLTLAALKIFAKNDKRKEIITPTLAWNSDVVSVIYNNFKPIFVDINLNNLSMDINSIKKKISKKTLAIFLPHIQGFNALSDELLNLLKKNKIYLIEDVCESHGAKFKKKKCGTFGLASNFSFYYAHHMTTIEGGMISTNNKKFYDLCKMMKGHGLVRESSFKSTRDFYTKKHKDLNKEFIFSNFGFNYRNNEIGAVLGINQLKRLNQNIQLRNKNFNYFLKNLNKDLYITNFDKIGCSNYAFPVLLRKKNIFYRNKFEKYLHQNNVEFRRGNAGGGNQLRQPYLKEFKPNNFKKFSNVERIHFFGYYIGNYPELNISNLKILINILNNF